MAVDFSPVRIVTSLALSGLSVNCLRLAKQDDEAIAARLTEHGHEATEEAVNSYRHRSVIYSALIGGAASLVYLARKG
jgi:hypothetical protein